MADPVPVRPTQRCLHDLGLTFPLLDQPLDQLPDPVVVKAQTVPAQLAAGGGERVLVATDRIWWKCKTSSHRAMVTELDHTTEQRSEIVDSGAWWWIGATGPRREGSPEDFYAALSVEVTRKGRGTGGASSIHLLPQQVDTQRLTAEAATIFVVNIRRVIRGLIAGSLRDGNQWSATSTKHCIGALVKTRDGDAYLAISADGFIEPKMIAIMLTSGPGLDETDWMAEPGSILGITPRPGQIIYSTMIAPEIQAAILDEFPVED